MGINKFEFIGEKMRKQIANIITSLRIICSILMLFCRVPSIRFCLLYIFCGLTDMVDGAIARKTNAVSEFGARLDSVADIIFVAVSLIKFLPVIYLQWWLCMWIVAIAVIKISNNVWGLNNKKKIISLHTIANKITGLLLFLLPLTLPFIDLQYSAPIVCFMATFAAIQEGYCIRTECEPI